MVIFMFDENDNHIKKINESNENNLFGKKTIIESYLKMIGFDKNLFPTGNVSYMKSEFKNDVFDTI